MYRDVVMGAYRFLECAWDSMISLSVRLKRRKDAYSTVTVNITFHDHLRVYACVLNRKCIAKSRELKNVWKTFDCTCIELFTEFRTCQNPLIPTHKFCVDIRGFSVYEIRTVFRGNFLHVRHACTIRVKYEKLLVEFRFSTTTVS